jgi:crossover junction endodeoxyribonuclease RuvC
MRVLGIDPGTATTGYGIVEETADGLRALAYGVITTPAKHPLSHRLQTIYQELSGLVQEWQPDEAAVEELFFSANVRTAMSVGQARGVVLLALAEGGVELAEYSPPVVKKALTGYGRADKRQMQDMVRLLLQLDEIPRPDDAADALAVAVCHLHSAGMRDLENA